jgi:hypothetical protein
MNWNVKSKDWDGQFEDFVDGIGPVLCVFEYIEPDDWEDGQGDVDMFVFDETGEIDLTYDIPLMVYKRLHKEARRIYFEVMHGSDY